MLFYFWWAGMFVAGACPIYSPGAGLIVELAQRAVRNRGTAVDAVPPRDLGLVPFLKADLWAQFSAEAAGSPGPAGIGLQWRIYQGSRTQGVMQSSIHVGFVTLAQAQFQALAFLLQALLFFLGDVASSLGVRGYGG